MNKYDAIIVGFGKGGKTLAAELASQNLKVAIVEKSEQMYGGTCINIGCIPSKTLVQQSKISHYKKFDTFEEQAHEYVEAISHKDDLISFLRKKNFDNLDQKDEVTIYTGEASFVSDHEIEVKAINETYTLYGDKIFINTGATTVIPEIKGIKESKNVFTSTTLMELKKLPKRLVIIGGGYIGLEFASIYEAFGSEVVVLENSSRFIAREDQDIADQVKSTMEKKNIKIKLNAKVDSIKDHENDSIVKYTIDGKTYEIHADAILVASGRKPNIEGLHLEAAGVRVTERGEIEVDKKLKTNKPHIWAIGDVKGGPQFTYISLDDFRIIKDDLFGNQKRSIDDRINIPYSVFINPPLSRVGLSEEEAIEKGYDIKVAKLPASAIPRARVLGESEGLLKTIVDKKTNKIIGCTLFCADSSEMINSVSIAMKTGQDYTFLKDHIFTHPTMNEALNDLFSLID